MFATPRSPMSLRAARAVLAVGLLLLAAPGARAGSPPEAVYAGAAPDPILAGRVMEMLANLSPPLHLEAPPEHLLQSVAIGPIPALGAEDSWTCGGSALSAADYRERVDGLYRDIWETEDLDPLFARARAWSACLTEPASPHDLARVSYIEGVMAHEYGEEGAARAAFAEALGIDPDYGWEPAFGPGALEAFTEVGSALSAAKRVTLEVVSNRDTAVWVDGRALAANAAELAAGRHLVQLVSDDGVRSLAVAVGSTPVTVVDPEALAGDPRLDAGYETRLLRVTTALFAALDRTTAAGAPDALVLLGGEPLAWTWDGTTLEPTKISRAARLALVPPERKREPTRDAAVGFLVAGIGMTAAGVAVTLPARARLDHYNDQVDDGLIAFPSPEDPDRESDPAYIEWKKRSAAVYVGYGLLMAGGAALLVSIPFGVRHERTKTLLSLRAAPLMRPDGDAATIDGFYLSVILR